jgi:hypothetical protein
MCRALQKRHTRSRRDTGLRTIGVAFDCPVVSGAEITLSEENDRFGWFPLDDLPEIAFDDVRQALEAAAS